MGVVRLSEDGSLWVHSPVRWTAPPAAVDAQSVPCDTSPEFLNTSSGPRSGNAPTCIRDPVGMPRDAREATGRPVGRRGGPATTRPARVARRVQTRVVRQRAQSLRRRRVFQRGGVRARTLAYAVRHGPVLELSRGRRRAPRDESGKFGMDVVYLPFYKRAMVDDANKYEATVERVCAWDFKRCCRATDRSSRAVPNASFANTSRCESAQARGAMRRRTSAPAG